jgi:deazaflavin-dependent oxidoreductase (nitroreductase family)
MPLFGRLTAASSEFANKRGIYLGRRSTKIHVALYRRSGGKLGGHVPGWPDARIVLVDHTGARSMVRRTSPLMYHEDGDAIAVAASKAGQPTHPAWFHNLKANPDTTIQIGSVAREVRARVATEEEHDRLWPQFVAFYPGYDFFQKKREGAQDPDRDPRPSLASRGRGTRATPSPTARDDLVPVAPATTRPAGLKRLACRPL